MKSSITDLQKIKCSENELLDNIDRVCANIGYHIPKSKAKEAKIKIRYAVDGFVGSQQKKRLNPKDIATMVNMITDIALGKTKAVQFQRIEDGGIEEIFSGKVFEFQ